MPFDHLVVLDHDVVAMAAGGALVSSLVELNEIFSDAEFGLSELGVDGDKHMIPLELKVADQHSVDLGSACLTGLANVGQVLEGGLPLFNELLDHSSDKGLSGCISEELIAFKGLPLVTTVVRRNPGLDLNVSPHGVARGGRFFDWFGDLYLLSSESGDSCKGSENELLGGAFSLV